MSRLPPSARAALAWAGLLALLAVATVLLLGLGPRFEPRGSALWLWPPPAPAGASAGSPVLGAAPDTLADPLEGWRVERGRGRVEAIDGVLRLEAPRADPYVLLRRALPLEEGVRAFRVSGEARFTGTGGARPVEAARIHLQGRDAAGGLLPDRREDAFNARASGDWTAVAAELALPPDAAAVELLVRLQRAAGRLELRRLEVEPLAEAPWRPPARLGLALAWLAALALGGGLLLRAAARPGWAGIALLAAAGGLVLILAPPDLLAILLPRPVFEALGRSETVPYLGHLGLAATLAFLVARAAGVRRPVLPALLVAVAAASGEAVQLLSVGRDSSPWDALANAAGGFFGVGLALAAGRLEPPPGGADPPEEPSAAIEAALPLVPLDAGGTPRG